MRRLGKSSGVLLSLVALAAVLTLTVSAQSPTPKPADGEFTLPIPPDAAQNWPVFVGVGHTLRYSPDWQALPHQSPGGIRNGATFDFIRLDGDAKIEVLEIVGSDTAVMATELSYWQRQAESGRYRLEAVTVQGQPAWWIYATEPQEATGRQATLWMDWGERSYRVRLRSLAPRGGCSAGGQPEVCRESEQMLRQMLSTLTLTEVSWDRAPAPPSAPAVEAAPGESVTTSAALASIPYYRGGAYTYAATYWEQEANDDDCYLWSNGSDLDCIYHDGDEGVDGADFVNRAVHAGWRPIPNQPALEGIRVTDLRDWLQSDGWSTIVVTQAQVGDVAIMGPFSTPCWVGLVVEQGSDPTLATHSDERWAPASSLYCYYNSQQTFEKTYLHADVEFFVYLPVMLRNWTQPTPKQWSGMHMGNRIYADWSSDMLAPFSPTTGGKWPRIVVAQSNQVFNINRYEEPDCRIQSVSVKNWTLFTYLREAALAGTQVVIRITPSPGNFQESIDPAWPNPVTRPPTRTLITEPGVQPGGWFQCGNEWRFRPVDDVGDEIIAIQHYILWQSPPGYRWSAFGFEPANEPNTEWYSYETTPPLNLEKTWQDMDQYFANLYDYVHDNAGLLPIRVLTPSMAQSAYAETNNINSDNCPEFDFSGYREMSLTFNSADPKNDGYSWHNYWVTGREKWADCPGGQHVSMWFPDAMASNIQSGAYPAIITEADLASPRQGMGNPLTDKDLDPALAATSIRDFMFHEAMAEYTAVWLLNDDTGSDTDHTWHQAFTPPDGFRLWFTTWWNGDETP